MRKHLLPLLALLTAIPAGASITGVVINGDGQPIAGAKVSIDAPESIDAHRLRLLSAHPERTALATMTTDSKGAFNFESPKGQPVVDLTVEANGFAPDAMRLLGDDEAGAIALVAAPTRRGTITANGKPVAGATVVWFGNGTDVMAKTDSAGHYDVPDPSKWATRLLVVHPDYAIFDELVPTRTKPVLDHSLSPGVSVSGRVVAADGTSPAAKASVVIDDFPLAVSGADGSFTIAHAPSNWQELEARSGNLAGVRAHNGKGALVIRLARTATISGSVRDAKSQLPVANAEVALGPEAQSFGRRLRGFFAGGTTAAIESVLSDAKGNFTMAAPAGRYTLTAVYPGSVVPQSQVSVTAGQSLNKTIYAAARARVTGSVLDENRRPIAGARLSAAAIRRGGPMMMVMGPFAQNSAFSGPDGRFVLRSVLTDMDVQIDAAKKGLPQSQSASMKLAAGERKSGVTITIPRGVALTGRVTDGSGRPVSGVSVEPVEAQGGAFGGRMVVRRVVNMLSRERDDDLVRTGSDGAFTIRVKPGTYDVIFKREGFSTRVLHGTSIDASAKPVEVKLDPAVEITGRVVRNGAGIEGANVNAISQDDMANAITGPDGSFALTDLTPGQMMVSVTKPDAFIQQMRPVTAPARDLVIELPSGGRITGRVVDKNTHNPVTAFQAGISFTRGAGGMVIAMPPMLKDFTSDDGSFTLENVPPGPTQVVVSAPGYTTAKVPGLNVEDGKSLDNVEVDLETGSRLTGRVTGSDGSPLSGVQVAEVSSDTGPARFMSGARATTDPNGEYSFDAIEPGQKTFTFSRQGYMSVDKSVNVTAGQSATLDAQLSSGMTVNGTVVTDGGVPVANAMVFTSSASARSDANGAFQMSGLAPGHYTFNAREDSGAQGVLRDFDIASGGSPRIVIAAGGTIMGHISGLTDTDLQNTTVFANGSNGSATASPDSSGAYRIDGAPTGTVHVMARVNRGIGAGGKASAPVSVQVDAGSTATADIIFKSDTVVQGRVTLNGQPMANVMVTFMPRSAGTSSSGTTDNNGSYSISGLDDGTYNVGVINIDRSSAYSSTYEVHGSGNYDIALKTVTVQGTVTDSTSGQPITGATIQLQASQGGFLGSRSVNSDPSGAFVVDNVSSGTYHVIVQKDGYGQAARDITVSDNNPPDPMQFQLAPSDGVTITVVDARDNRQLSANAVRVVDAAGNAVDSGGRFFFGGTPQPLKLSLAPGQYTVTLVAQGYATKVVTVSSPSQITVGLTPGGIVVFRSKASTKVTARLLDANGAIYRTFVLDAAPMTTTLNAVAPGNYTLQVLDGTGAVVNTLPVTVVDGQQNVIDV